MSLTTPTTSEISNNIVAQLQTTLNQTLSLLPKSFINTLAKVLAGVYVILYKYAGFNLLQQFVTTASFQETTVGNVTIRPLIEWGRLIGIGDPIPPTNAVVTVTLTRTVTIGIVPANTQLQGANGVTYLTLNAVDVSTGVNPTVDVRASQDQSNNGGAGSIGNLTVGETLSFVNPQSLVAANAVVSATVTTGVDGESEVDYRQRVINRFQKRPQGGALADWEAWCNEVADVKNTYVYAGLPGEVDLFIESKTATDGIANSTLLNAVSAHIAPLRPVSSWPYLQSITRSSFNVTVTGLYANDVASCQAAIQSALQEHFLSLEPFIVGLSLSPRKDRVTDTTISSIISQVVSEYDGYFTNSQVVKGASIITVYTLLHGEKAKLGTLTFS